MADLRPSEHSAMLHQDDARSITLLDIPRSIERGQCLHGYTLEHALISTSPVSAAFPSTEPKATKARERLLQQYSNDHLERHKSKIESARQALETIKAVKNDSLPWCLNRTILPNAPSWEPPLVYANGESCHSATPNPYIVLSPYLNSFSGPAPMSNTLVLSPAEYSTVLEIAPWRYRIPPASAFVLGDVCDSLPSMSFTSKKFLPSDQHHKEGQFDFILLDPPWHNRSVKRSRAYSTPGQSVDYPLKVLEPFLKEHVATNGYIGVWVTNRESIQKAVLASMNRCGLELFEEWIWLKITAHGEPILVLDGLWRHPYEVMMIFQKPASGVPTLQALTAADSTRIPEVRRRVIVAVPEAHSRKPCLKEVLEGVFLEPGRQRFLEIFARNLTAGWWSWGDEVLKTNWEGHWVEKKEPLDT